MLVVEGVLLLEDGKARRRVGGGMRVCKAFSSLSLLRVIEGKVGKSQIYASCRVAIRVR